MCCYEREAFTPHTPITATTTQDGCTTSSIECRLDGNKAKMVFHVENNCPIHLMENQINALEGKVDVLEDKVDSVEGKVDFLIQLVEQQTVKTGKLI